MLIRNADVWKYGPGDVRVTGGLIAAIGRLTPHDGEEIVDAQGGALLPGLHDHHIHLCALAVAGTSIPCGPPEIGGEAGLAEALARPGTGWLRGIGYDEGVAGLLHASQIDRLVPDRPVRIQHRSGRMWFLNSMALDLLLEAASPPPGLERDGSGWSGRLFDEDVWLRKALNNAPPAFAEVSRTLAKAGVTGITDLSPANDGAAAAHFSAERAAARLGQRCVIGGTLSLSEGRFDAQLLLGPAKLHLHEAALPDLDATIAFIRSAHLQDRPVAIHCVTETELVFALAVLETAGHLTGDRIEHASVAPDVLVEEMSRMGVHVVSQPHFIAERGDRYLREVEKRDIPTLYRLGALRRAGIVLAGGSDAPYGSCDPWAAMRAAISRRTAAGVTIGRDEELTPEQALALYLADPHDLTRERQVAPGASADLCLLDLPWDQARHSLDAGHVRATLVGGSIIHAARR